MPRRRRRGVSGADGPNALVEQRRRGPFLVFLSQFSDFMVIVLLVAAALAGAIGETLDAVAILVIVVLNAIFGFLHEHRAAQSIALLRALAAPQARVRRSGAVRSVPAAGLVRGDLVLLEAGNVVPADLRLTQVASLRVDESVLTGESHPVDKHTAPSLKADEPLGDRRGMAFSGTVVTYGNGAGVVTATGMATELGGSPSCCTPPRTRRRPCSGGWRCWPGGSRSRCWRSAPSSSASGSCAAWSRC